MNKSESIKEIATALAKFQGEVKNPANTATNPFFKSKYAPLETVLNTVRPLLSKHGLSVIQTPISAEGMIGITTLLLHESGEYIEFLPVMLNMDKPTAQGAGSAITYARRYAISAILGISSEDDDDGNNAELKAPANVAKSSNVNKPTQTPKTPKKTVDKDLQVIDDNSMASEKQLEFIYKLAKQKEYEDKMTAHLKMKYNKDSSKDLNKKEASEIIKMLNEI